MRHVSALAVAIIIGACAGCRDCEGNVIEIVDGGDVATADAGSLEDGGSDDGGQDSGPYDAGPALLDAGEVDAGDGDAGQEDVDAGVVDAGPECFIDGGITPFDCEGDEDFCDPLGDSSSPNVDIIAAWSRINADGAFELDLRFAAPPYAGGPRQVLFVGLFEDDDETTDDVLREFQLEDCVTFEPILTDRVVELINPRYTNQPDSNPYPPYDYTVFIHNDENGHFEGDDLCDAFLVSDDLLTLRVIIHGDFPYTSGRHYLVESRNFLSCDAPPSGFIPVLSLAGEPDNQNFASICDVVCPQP